MTGKVYIALALLLALFSRTTAQERIYTPDDSVFIENIIERHSPARGSTPGEAINAIAGEFIGERYIAGTLENQGEPLYISRSKLDCTTFVEMVVAVYSTIKEGLRSFGEVCRNIEKVRYLNGRRDGYASRLHYISWWIDNNKNIVHEVLTEKHTAVQQLNLKFMSSNPDNYPALTGNAARVEAIAELEKPYRGIDIKYIPKESVTLLEKTDVKEGDIIAIVTAIEGLDVSHLGFAKWHGEVLHMIHASSQKGEVVDDMEPLADYLKNRKNHLGIRVLRVIE